MVVVELLSPPRPPPPPPCDSHGYFSSERTDAAAIEGGAVVEAALVGEGAGGADATPIPSGSRLVLTQRASDTCHGIDNGTEHAYRAVRATLAAARCG